MEFGNTMGAFVFQSCVEVFLFLISILVIFPISWWFFKSKAKSYAFLRALLTSIATFVGLSVLSFWGLLHVMSPNSPRKKPASSEIVGTYSLSPFTTDHLVENYRVSIPVHSLVFNEDGTFYLENVLNFYKPLESPNQDDNKIINASGNWWLEQASYGDWQIHIEVLTSTDKDLEGMQDIVLMEGRYPPYQILIITEQNIDIFRFTKQ